MRYVCLRLLIPLAIAGALLAACGAQGGPVVPTSPAPAASPTQLSPTPLPTITLSAPASTPTTVNPTITPAGLTGKFSTYKDEVAGIELDYPEGWHVVDVAAEMKKQSQGYAVTFASWKPGAGGGEGIPQVGTKFDLTLRPTTSSALPEIVAARKQEHAASAQPPSIISEEEWTLKNGAQAVHWQLDSTYAGKSALVITALNGKLILLEGRGDLALFDQIARTLRTISAATVKGMLPADAVWVCVNGRVTAVAPGNLSVDLTEPGAQVFSGAGQSTVAPDGSALLYFRFTTNPQNQELMVLDTHTGEARRLVQAPTIWSARFSPDGRSVAYTVITGEAYADAKWELRVSDLAGSGSARVVLSGGHQTPQDTLAPLVPVDWSPKGLYAEKIIWASDAPPQGLYRVELTDASLKTVYDNSYVRAVVSPDGTRVVLVQGQIQMGPDQPQLALNLLDVASGQVKALVPETAIRLTSLRWSPDSSRILYTVQDSGASTPSEVRVIRVDGSDEQRLSVQVQYILRDVTWRDNSSLVFLFVDPQNVLHVSRAPLESLNLHSLVEIGRVHGADPQNPGDQFIYVPGA